jgi:hypothetical protein
MLSTCLIGRISKSSRKYSRARRSPAIDYSSGLRFWITPTTRWASRPPSSSPWYRDSRPGR